MHVLECGVCLFNANIIFFQHVTSNHFAVAFNGDDQSAMRPNANFIVGYLKVVYWSLYLFLDFEIKNKKISIKLMNETNDAQI